MLSTPEQEQAHDLAGLRVALVGKLAGMSKREAQQLIRQHGGVPVEKPDAAAELVVVGEGELPLGDGGLETVLDESRSASEPDRLQVISETQLWERLGLVDCGQHVHCLYTPAMLADLIGVKVEIVRRWHRRGLIVPAREVRRLPYFDFQEVATARRLAELLAAGMSPQAIEKKLAQLGRFLPDVERPLAQLSVIVRGKQLLLRQGDGLLAPGGQLYFDFQPPDQEGAQENSASAATAAELDLTSTGMLEPAAAATADELLDAAAELEDNGLLDEAAEMYRAALAAGGPTAEACFRLAELLYRTGDAAAARERYYMAIELDEDYVEARANLGCVLAEMGQRELALAAFEGALAYHPDYPDAHYHLARTLDEAGLRDQAERHWRSFVELAPQSPWAAEAQARLQQEVS